MEKSIQVGNIKICRSNVLDKGEKEQISLLVSVCNRADGTCNELFLTNEFNVYPEMPCFSGLMWKKGIRNRGLPGFSSYMEIRKKWRKYLPMYFLNREEKGFFMLFFIRPWSISGFWLQ